MEPYKGGLLEVDYTLIRPGTFFKQASRMPNHDYLTAKCLALNQRQLGDEQGSLPPAHPPIAILNKAILVSLSLEPGNPPSQPGW